MQKSVNKFDPKNTASTTAISADLEMKPQKVASQIRFQTKISQQQNLGSISSRLGSQGVSNS